jgi:hypothetical protein
MAAKIDILRNFLEFGSFPNPDLSQFEISVTPSHNAGTTNHRHQFEALHCFFHGKHIALVSKNNEALLAAKILQAQQRQTFPQQKNIVGCASRAAHASNTI